MKKYLCILLAAMLLTVSLAQAESLAGSWAMVEKVNGDEDTSDIRGTASDAFDKAMADFTDSKVEMIDVIATQVVAGVNYLYLVAVTPVVPGAQLHVALAEVYADLEGNATLTGLKDIGEELTGLAGGWTDCAETEFEPEEFENFWSALDTLIEENIYVYRFTVLSQQVVAGMNYQLLVTYALIAEGGTEDEPVYTDTGIALATIYVDLSGNAAVTAFEPVELDVDMTE